MADLGTLSFGVHLVDYTDSEANKIKTKLENLTANLKIDGKTVTVENTDAIKKQIEDAIKSVAVKDVSVDTAAIRTKLQNATQNLQGSVKVTLLKNTMASDLQTYLDTKTFRIGISITKGSAKNALTTAFANFSVPVNVQVSANAVLQSLRQTLATRQVSVGVKARNVGDFIKDLEKRLQTHSVKIGVKGDANALLKQVRQALQGAQVKANVKVNVDASAITNAVQQAINNASFTYHPKGGKGGSGGGGRSGGSGGSGGWNPNATKGLYESARASVTLGNSLRTNIRLAGELGTELGNFASLFGIKDLAVNVVRIGGELENQRIALGAILRDAGKATEMFGKIESLAVKSPFGIMDLNQYTKQLAAYGIEYNELYDTMKRMADISAGVGVDMGRIILAFGQVRAAGFLKGTELRQFTEANIPMVQALADRFSLLEKRIVSAAEVYDMISEKKVSFEDVKAVLWELTGEGGRFNNMQEVLSESLASKWKNLADAVDVMYGKLAEGGIGDWLKGLAEGLTEVTKQWEYMATAIKSAAAVYLVYRNQVKGRQAVLDTPINNLLKEKDKEAATLRMTALYRNLTKAEQKLVDTTGQLNVADAKRFIRSNQLNRSMAVRLIQLKQVDEATSRYLVKLYRIQQAELEAAVKVNVFRSALTGLGRTLASVGAALKSMFWNPYTAIFAVVGGIAEIWTYFSKKSEEIEQRNKDVAESAKGSAETLERELLKIKDMDISKMNTDEIKIKIKDLTTLIKDEAFGWQGILDDVFAQEADGTFTHSAAEQLKMLKEKVDEIAEAKKALMENNESYSNVIGATESGGIWGLGSRDVIDAMKALNEAVDENDKKLRRLGAHLEDVVDAVRFASSENTGLSALLNGKNPIEQIEILHGYESEWSKFKNKLSEINEEASKTVEEWDKNIKDVTTYTVGGYLNALLWKFGKAKEAMMTDLTLSGEDINNLGEKGAQMVKGFVEMAIKESSTQKGKMKQFYYDWWTEAFDIDWVDLGYIVPPTAFGGNSGTTEKYDASKDEVAKLWKQRTEEIEKAVKMYDQWKKVEGADKARARVQSKDELANLFNGAYGFNLDLENPTAAYAYIQSKLNEKLSAQKELIVTLGVKISDAELKDANEKLKQFVERTKAEIKETADQFNLYKQLFEATGDKEFAMTAFQNTQVWDDVARAMKANLDKALEDAGFGFESTFEVSDEQAKVMYRDLYDSWKEIKDRIEKNGIDLKVNVANAKKETMTLEEKITALRNVQADELKKIEDAFGKDSDAYKAKAAEFEHALQELKIQLFELSPAFKQIFQSTVGMSINQLSALKTEIQNVIDAVNKGTKNDKTGRIDFSYNGKDYSIDEEGLRKLMELLDKTSEKTKTLGDSFARMWSWISGKEYEGQGKLKFGNVTEDLSSIADGAAEAADSLAEMFDSLGHESLADGLALASNIMKGVGDIGKGIASKDPFAVLGGATGIISSIAQHHDKKLDRAIQKSQLEVKKLSNAYKNLETDIERQLGGATAGQAAKMIGNLRAQREELVKQYEAEDDKKKTDESKLEDYKQQMAEIDDQLKHFYEDLAKEQYNADIKDWAGQIASALTEAFASGEDAAKAFDNTVGSILQNLATDAIRLQFIEPAMASLRDYMFGDNGIFHLGSENGTDLSVNEAAGLSKELEKLKGQIAASNEYWDKINEATGGLLDSSESLSSGGLTKSIQGVTEDTANLLGSYLNAMRQDVSVKRSLVEQLVNEAVPKMNYLAEAQLQQMQMVVANTKRNADAADKIYDLVNRVVDKSSNKLKV